jgi:hypothetical protein
MSAPPSISKLDRWLARPPVGAARPLVTLNARPGTLPPGFAGELREYLAGLDDESDEWQALDTGTFLELVTHPLQATNGRALAPADGCTGCKCPGDDCGTRKKYKAAVTLLQQVARRGGAVVTLPGACRATRDFGHAFHVWFECSMEHRIQRLASWNHLSAADAETAITDAARRQEDWLNAVFGPRSEGCGLYCHLTLNLDQLTAGPVIPIVGDTVLEWAAARDRSLRQRRGQDLREESQPVPGTDAGNILPFPGQ